MCEGSDGVPITKAFSQYIDLRNKIHRRLCSPRWMEGQFIVLSTQIGQFKKATEKIFGPCQTSNMEISTLHALSHLVDSSRQMCGIEYLDADIFDRSHQKL